MSEFGKGFTYCIGLFLAHTEREEFSLWFNGAVDHLFDLEIPEDFTFKKECEEWQKKCLHWRLSPYAKGDKDWAIKQAKIFLLEWDKQKNIPCEVGNYE